MRLLPVGQMGGPGGLAQAEVVAARGGYPTLAASVREGRFDVRDYGAKGNGTTDDTAAFVAADAAAAAVNGMVYIPASINTYLVSFGTNIWCLKPSSGTTWQGDGMFSSVIELDPGSTVPTRMGGGLPFLSIGSPTAGVYSIAIRDIGLVPHWTTKGGANKYICGVYAPEQTSNFTQHSDDITIERVRVRDSYIGIGCTKTATTADAGYTASRHQRWTIAHCLINTVANKAMDLQMFEDSEVVDNTVINAGDGLQLLNYAARIRLARNSIHYVVSGINVREGCEDIDVDGNIVSAIGGGGAIGGSGASINLVAGIVLGTERETAAVASSRVVIRNNIVNSAASDSGVPIMLTSYDINSGATFTDFLITDNMFNGGPAYLTDTYNPANSSAVRLRVFDNHFAGGVTTNAGWVSDRTRFERNHVTSAFTANSNNWDFRDNVFAAGYSDTSTGSTWDAGTGTIVQVRTAASTSDSATTADTYQDSSLSLAFTPLFANSILHISVEGEYLIHDVSGVPQSIRYGFYQIYNSTNAVAIHEVVRGAIVPNDGAALTHYGALGLRGYYTVNSTATRTFKLQYKSGVVTDLSASVVGSRGGSGVTMTIMEVRP